MNRNKNKQQIIQHIIDEVFEYTCKDPEEVNIALKEFGYDPDALVNEGIEFIHDKIREKREKEAYEKSEKLSKKIQYIEDKFKSYSNNKIISEIQKLFEQLDRKPAIQFHKLKNTNNEQLLIIYKDLLILSELDNKKED